MGSRRSPFRYGHDWWRRGVVYQVYPRSFADGDGDGMGDLNGLIARLPYLGPDGLGVDAIWLSPIYPSPGFDIGYDVSDHGAVDPRFGSEADFDHLVAEAHRLGIRVILDLRAAMLASRQACRLTWQEPPMPDLPDLVPLDLAQTRVLEGVTALPAEVVDLADARGLVLAAPVHSALTVPAWINSAMDGFAVRGVDIAAASAGSPVVLRVLGEVAAGRPPEAAVAEGTAIRIMTGAMLPDGADTVVPVEDTDAPAGASDIPASVAIFAAVRKGDHIRRPGSDVKAGAHLLGAGRACDAAAIALLAATGHASVSVHRRPRVAVISTGDELVPPGLPLGPGQIHDSNSLTLAAQATEAGAEVRRLGVARDTLADLLTLLREAVAWADVVVLSGGVSVGAHDHVKAAFDTLGDLALWRVAIKPGRPFAFARAAVDGRSVRLFGLPGNPVSVFVTFELFVRPVLRRLAGHTRAFDRPTRIVRLAEPMRGSSGRQNITRVVLVPDPDRPDGLLARSSGGQDSYMLASLAAANAMIFIPPDANLPVGAEVVAWELRNDEG